MINTLKNRRFHSLKNLDLDFYGCKKLSDKALEFLAQEIHNFQALEHLNLSFGDCHRLTDQGSAVLVSQICQKLNKLQTVNLNFTKSSQEVVEITDITIQSLAENIKELKELRCLTLNFNG